MSQESLPSGERDFFEDDRSMSEIQDIIKYHQEQVAYWKSRLVEKRVAERAEIQAEAGIADVEQRLSSALSGYTYPDPSTCSDSIMPDYNHSAGLFTGFPAMPAETQESTNTRYDYGQGVDSSPSQSYIGASLQQHHDSYGNQLSANNYSPFVCGYEAATSPPSQTPVQSETSSQAATDPQANASLGTGRGQFSRDFDPSTIEEPDRKVKTKIKFDAMFLQGAFQLGDCLVAEVLYYDKGTKMELQVQFQFLAVNKHPKRRLPSFEVTTAQLPGFHDVLDCKGTNEIIDFLRVRECFGKSLDSTPFSKKLDVYRDGTSLGSYYSFKRKYQLWVNEQDEQTERTGVQWRPRRPARSKKPGSGQ